MLARALAVLSGELSAEEGLIREAEPGCDFIDGHGLRSRGDERAPACLEPPILDPGGHREPVACEEPVQRPGRHVELLGDTGRSERWVSKILFNEKLDLAQLLSVRALVLRPSPSFEGRDDGQFRDLAGQADGA